MQLLINKLKGKIIRHKKTSAIILAVVVGLIYIGSQIFTKAQSPTYETQKAQVGTLISSVSASGQVAALSGMAVTTQASGIVSNIYVKDGDTVIAGQPIAWINLDSSGLIKKTQALNTYLASQADLNSLQAAMFKANQTFLNDKGSSATPSDTQKQDPVYIEENANWLAAEAAYKNQQLVISQAWLSYQQVSDVVYAPISGTVSGLAVQVGSYLAPSSSTTSVGQNAVATITNDGTPVISVNLSEIDAPKIKIGNKATITFDALPNKTFTGSVQSLNTQGVVTSGVTTYPATIALDTNSPEIFGNMSATANIITQIKDNALSVPSAAIQTQGGQSVVRVLKNGQVKSVVVETGISSDTQTEIVSGISEDDEVITGIISSSSTRSSASPFGIRSFGGGGAAGGGGAVRIQTGGR
ncbi:MAG TPA: efflux RND transporter periplasmic adaptor subunit [Patescibacteria group bacterium]|nr:efflux RND transporter periplasmic adaptor subunit [Patescibacteria group bacterium]